MALGALSRQVAHTVVIRTMRAVVVGSVLGIAVAPTGTRILDALLFAVGPRDPFAFAATVGALFSAALAAALLAARHAIDIAPVFAMRSDG